jgi:hypothetical protein
MEVYTETARFLRGFLKATWSISEISAMVIWSSSSE